MIGAQTPLKVSIAATAASLVLLLVVFELIRSRRLRERYALLWILTGFVLVALSAWRGGRSVCLTTCFHGRPSQPGGADGWSWRGGSPTRVTRSRPA